MAESDITIKLTHADVDYLNNTDIFDQPQIEAIRKIQWVSNATAKLQLSLSLSESFRSTFTERLASAGFDENYEPTIEGKVLEKLIDRFYSQCSESRFFNAPSGQ